MKKVEYISVPKGLALTLAKDSKQLRTISVFYQLKSIYVGGIIHDFSSRAKEIATSFGYSERKLRTYISELKDLGLVSIDANKKSLTLRASKFVGELYSVSDKKYHKVKVDNINNLEQVLKGIAISENLVRQAYELKNKVINKAIAQSVGITTLTNYQPNHSRRLKAIFAKQFDRTLAKFQKRYTDSISNLEIPDIDLFPYVTLTRQGIANMFGKASKATGHSYAKKLSSLGIINDKRSKDVVIMENATWEDYSLMQINVIGHDYSYKFDKVNKIIYKVLPNDISLNDSSVVY
jgi:hypothetical protein